MLDAMLSGRHSQMLARGCTPCVVRPPREVVSSFQHRENVTGGRYSPGRASHSEPRNDSKTSLVSAGRSCCTQCPQPSSITGSRNAGTHLRI